MCYFPHKMVPSRDGPPPCPASSVTGVPGGQDLAAFEINFNALITFDALLAGAPPLEHTIPKMTLTQLLQKVGANEAAVKKTGCVISVQATPPSLLL